AQGGTPARIGENLSVPGNGKTLRREGQRLFLVDRDTGDHRQGHRHEHRDDGKPEEFQKARAHVTSRREPTSRVRPTSASEMSTRKTAMAEAKGMLDW